MSKAMPRILFAAPKSGSGKTMITCAVIELCKRRNLKTASFKCGPDYIDPMFHRKVLGIPSGNLDTFFTDEKTTRYLLSKKAKQADITILEGVMGYYDGLSGTSERASTYEVARVTKTPVILVVDGKGASVSLAAVIKGIMEYRKDSGIKGILLNRVSAGFYDRLKTLIEKECRVPVLGFMPELKDLTVPSRHLGLIAPEELGAFQSWIRETADTLEKTIDFKQLFAIAEGAEELEEEEPSIKKLTGKVRIGIARDEAFSFYYSENLQLLEKMGGEIVTFSPIHDKQLPEGLDGLILGGGYPEIYAKELEEAREMRSAVKEACLAGMPVLAECGGFMYLQKELQMSDGSVHEMAGVLNGGIFPTGKLCRFGYIEASALTSGILGEAGSSIKGHEFHYFDCSINGDAFSAQKPLAGSSYPCMVHTASMAAGFPHFYYYSNPDMLYHYLESCRSFRAGRLAKKHWDDIAKPIDSLGLLEDMTVKLCRIKGEETPYDLSKKALLVLCADHGVVKEGVTQTDSSVTKIVSENFAKGMSSVNYMAKTVGVDVYTVDMGINGPCYPDKELKTGAVIDRKVAKGSSNLAEGPAMTARQCRAAVETGIELVGELKKMGYTIVATGEMGIGNTTPTSALAAVFLNLQPEAVTGKGAGLSKEGINRKCQVVLRAVNRVKEKGLTDPMDILAEVGGLEIAAMAGVFLGGIKYRMPIVIDGAISCVAALAAFKIDCRAADFMLASHQSEEVTGKLALKALSLKAPVHAGMCLGEGSGAVALFPLLTMGMEVYKNMGSFSEYQIEAYTRFC